MRLREAMPDAGPPIPIIGLGASTPLGRDVWASAAAVRAGVCGFSEHPFMSDGVGEPMRVARAPWLDPTILGATRYCELLFPAIDEALQPLEGAGARDTTRLGLAIALPPPRPGRPADLCPVLQQVLSERYPLRFVHTAMFESGHAAGYLAYDAAMQRLMAASLDACVVAGVDSYLMPETLEWIEECDQLNGAGRLNNAWGFIPGEAAGATLIATPVFVARVGATVYGQIVSLGLGREPNLIKTEAVCIGQGLTLAFRAALRGLGSDAQIHNVFCDLNGETYRADEYGFTALRTKERFRAASDFVAPAECWGDIGAAGAPLHAALAVIAHRKRYAKGPLSLVCGSSESGERGAAVIAGAAGERG